MKKFEIINHTADTGIIAYGKTLIELFENAASGMFKIITDTKKVRPQHTVIFKLDAPNYEELLVSWLRELLYKHNTQESLFSEFKIKNLSQTNLRAEAKGEKLDISQHKLDTEIKAVTYHQLKIEKKDNFWRVQVIFDV